MTQDRPILFSGPMVRAILEGRKTQTRRVMKPQPVYCGRIDEYEWDAKGQIGVIPLPKASKFCPYGVPGDRLWVKETWCRPLYQTIPHDHPSKNHPIIYAADNGREFHILGRNWHQRNDIFKWKTSIFMPRWASRINLEITGIRVERLQDISADDIRAEGTPGTPHESNCLVAERQSFIDLWYSINAKPKPVYASKKIVSYVSYPWENIQETRTYRGKPWEVIGNPYLWVIGFRRLQ